mmetsp:Transcript_15577/g.29751  ORF Transcript_15577/g.29751 Transcript_15577/m.29751 type:complete len:92 (+) Transcript_15577:168-443(+)
MEKGKLTLHPQAVNIARRYTEMNENDLVMENLYEDSNNVFKKNYTKQECMELARHMMHESSLPSQCQKYSDVVVDLRRRDSDTTHPTQYLS